MAGNGPTEHHDAKGRFLPGNNASQGRPKGSRNKLGEQFIQDLYADWIENGAAAVAKVRDERPHDYLKVVASILPKELHVKESPLEEMSADDIRDALARIAALRSVLIGQDGTATPGRTGPAEKRKSH